MADPGDSLSVAELLRRLRRAVELAAPGTWVDGEVGSLRWVTNGHAYFTLKDEQEDAVVDCVLFRSQVVAARRHLADGARLQVFAKGTVYLPRGRLQLVIDRVRPQGRGALLEALERLRLRLAEEGLFASERKRSLPDEPRVIAVVTSATGAAFQDVRTVAFRRGGARLLLVPALVQGDGAPESLVRALALAAQHPEVDVVIVGRGGGSFEDLQAFNDERVVRAIAASPVPVVSAVGHEIDTTLADLAADVRAATPSQAAELVVRDAAARRDRIARLTQALARAARARLLEDGAVVARLRRALIDPRFLIADRQQQLDELRARSERLLRRALARWRQAVALLARRVVARHPRAVVLAAGRELGRHRGALVVAVRARLGEEQRRLAGAAARLDALSPLGVLGRGYAIVVRRAPGIGPAELASVSRPEARVVRSAAELSVGESVSVRLGKGRIDATVTNVHRGEEAGTAGTLSSRGSE